MKKRFVLTVLVIVITTILICGCASRKTSGDNTSVYDKLNELAKVTSSEITLSVSSEKGGDILSGSYTIKEENGVQTVTYTYENFAKFELVDGEYVIPERRIVTISGSVKIKDGKVIEQNGASANIPLGTLSVNGLSFKESYFTTVNTASGEFSANVSNPSLFVGQNIACTDMTVKLKYTDICFSELVIKYTDDSLFRIELKYIFA